MYKPRRINSCTFFIKIVKYNFTSKKPDHNNYEYIQAEPTNHHCYVINCKYGRTEQISKLSTGYSFKRYESETTEEKLFQKELTKDMYSETNTKFSPVTPMFLVNELVIDEKSKISLSNKYPPK